MTYKEVIGPDGKPVEYKYELKPIAWMKPLWQCRKCKRIYDDPAKCLTHAKRCKKGF